MSWTTNNETVDDLLADVWDTRDLAALVEKLEAEQDDTAEDYEEQRAELDRARTLADELRNYAEDFDYGATVIRDSYFVEYAQQLAEDVGAIDSEAGWPACHIDWDAAAAALRMDYTSITFEGEDWWVR